MDLLELEIEFDNKVFYLIKLDHELKFFNLSKMFVYTRFSRLKLSEDLPVLINNISDAWLICMI